jgi:hypothetical protein
MKIFILSVFLFCNVLISAYSQKLYIKASGGYNFSLGYNTIGTNEIIEQKFTRAETVNGTYGAGYNQTISVGYMLTKNISIEIGGTNLTGKDYQSFFSKDVYEDHTRVKLKQDLTTHARMKALTAAMVLATDIGRFQPYAKAGLLAGKPKILYIYKVTTDDKTYDFVSEETGNITLGLQSSIGINFPISSRWVIYTEGTYTALAFSPEKNIITQYKENGNDLLQWVQVYHKETIYKSSIKVTDEPVSGPLNHPREELRHSVSFNAIGLQVGVKFNLL